MTSNNVFEPHGERRLQRAAGALRELALEVCSYCRCDAAQRERYGHEGSPWFKEI
jgi:hypothetical protein